MSVEVTLDAGSVVPPANQQQQQQQQQQPQQQQQQENPFQEDGELRRKADYIISHSRISRTEVQIVDPDSPQPTTTTTLVTPSDGGHGTLVEEESVEAPVERSKVTEVHSNPPAAAAVAGGGAANGSVQDPVTVVEVEVKSAETKTDDRPQTAEQVKLKSKKKCCSVQ